MQVALYLAGEINQVKESIPWARCALAMFFTLGPCPTGQKIQHFPTNVEIVSILFSEFLFFNFKQKIRKFRLGFFWGNSFVFESFSFRICLFLKSDKLI